MDNINIQIQNKIKLLYGFFSKNSVDADAAISASYLHLFSFVFHLIVIIAVFSLAGCSINTSFNPATGQQETLIHDTDKEVLIGAKVAQKLEEEYELVSDVDMNLRIEAIMDKIIPVVDRQDVVYTVGIIDDDEINALALPGGYLYLFRGVIDHAENDDEIAGVLAHEIAHVVAKHSIKRMQLLYGRNLLLGAAVLSGNNELATGVDVASTSALFQYSQADEHEADRLGVKYLKLAGYDPNAMVTFLKKLQEEQKKSPRRRYGYWRTHPRHGKRISAANVAVTGEMSFKDYLNLTEEEKKW